MVTSYTPQTNRPSDFFLILIIIIIYLRQKKKKKSRNLAKFISKKNVTYIDLISPGTIDEKIINALRDKIDIASQVLGESIESWIV